MAVDINCDQDTLRTAITQWFLLDLWVIYTSSVFRTGHAKSGSHGCKCASNEEYLQTSALSRFREVNSGSPNYRYNYEKRK